MELTSSSSDVTFRPHILASGEGARTFFTFQTFMLNRFGMIVHDFIAKGLIKGNVKAKMTALIGLGILTIGKMAEDEAREYLYGLIMKRKLPPRSVYQDVALSIPAHIPVFGGIFEMVHRRTNEIPLVKIVGDAMRVFLIPFMEKPEAQVKAALRGVEAAATLGAGMPGTAQAFDVIEGLLFGATQTSTPKPAIRPKAKQ